MSWRIAIARVLLGAAALSMHGAAAQQPFALDASFRAQFNDWYVSSILPLDDGKLIISGQIRFPGDQYFRLGARLNADGTRDPGFPEVTYMGGKLTEWNGRTYALNGIGVRRLFLDGLLDFTFDMVNAPYFSALQGGDYHVYPDGRILMSGAHTVNLPDSGWSGLHNLIWFTNTGRLDTTRAPRKGNGVIYRFKELPDGKFICTGPMTEFEGQPTSYIFRVHADGMLDTTFTTNTIWGQAACYLPLDDGRCYVGGLFRVNGITDTLNLVRMMPDGSLDPTFHNTIRFGIGPPITSYPRPGTIESIQYLDNGRLIVTGAFRDVDGEPRNSIALIDTTGQLLDDHFVGAGCGTYTYQGFTDATIMGLQVVEDDRCYIWGSYHGYSDGTTSDPLQRFVTRLYGPDFNTAIVQEELDAKGGLRVYPNPAHDRVAVDYKLPDGQQAALLILKDALGRPVLQRSVAGRQGQVVLDLGAIARGAYVVELRQGGTLIAAERLVVQ